MRFSREKMLIAVKLTNRSPEAVAGVRPGWLVVAEKGRIEFDSQLIDFGGGTGLRSKLKPTPYPDPNEFRCRAKLEDAKGARVARWTWDVFLVKGR